MIARWLACANCRLRCKRSQALVDFSGHQKARIAHPNCDKTLVPPLDASTIGVLSGLGKTQLEFARPIWIFLVGNCIENPLAKNAFAGIIMSINGTPNNQREAVLANTDRTLESAAHFTRGGSPPAPDHDASFASRASRIKAEQSRLIQWAQENGKLSRSRRLPPEFTHGGEHEVFFQKHRR